MIKIFDSLLLNSLLGLGIIFIIFVINLILSRRKTLPVIILDQLFFTIIAIILFGWPCIIYGVIFFALIVFKRYRDKWYSERSYLDFGDRIYSVSHLINSLRFPKNEVVVGKVIPANYLDIKNNGKAIPLTDIILSGSTLISGSTGSGKTRTMMSVITQAVLKNKPIFFFDFKGEEDILDELEELANKQNIPFYEFSSRKISFKYDPFVNLNTTGKIQALMNSKSWAADGSDSHYKTTLQALLQDVVPAYEQYRKENEDNSNFIVGLNNYLNNIYKVSPNHRDGYGTLKSIIDLMVTSRVRDMLENNNPEFSFDNDDQCIIAFSFPSSNKDLANYICAFIMQDIMDRGTRKRYINKPLLAIDEFGTLQNSTLIKDILEKGRSVGLQTIFSILDLNQLVENVSQAFAQSVLGIINTFIIHAGATTTTAELMGSVYRYDSADWDIMNCEKPQNGKPPTCYFISKYKVLNDRGAQEAHKMIPYIKSLVNIKENKPTKSANKVIENASDIKDVEPGVELEEPNVYDSFEEIENQEIETQTTNTTFGYDEDDIF